MVYWLYTVTVYVLSGLPNSLTFNDIETLNPLNASSVDYSTNQSTSLQSKIYYDLQRNNYARDSLL